jgi:hypothetical protein
MAIYGIGAFYSDADETNVSAKFIERGIACVGWSEEDAPAIHRVLKHIKTGEVIYIKAHPPGRTLTIRAVGIVEEETLSDFGELGWGLRVRWLWTGADTLQEATEERYNVRANTLYEEFSQTVQTRILDLLFSAFQAKAQAKTAK